MLVLSNRDVPGVIGRIGTCLGQKGVNIVDFALARGSGGRAAAVVRVDPPAGGDRARSRRLPRGAGGHRVGPARDGRVTP